MDEFERKKTLGVIGLMSGTSLDGLDLCFATFQKTKGVWTFENLKTTSRSYSADIKKRLTAVFSHGYGHPKVEKESKWFGEYLGHSVNTFIAEQGLAGQVDLIASHGHTIFHEPEKGYTVQIGDGQCIANLTKLPTVFDFRSRDVSLGGQGAPLVPIGDLYLFSNFGACLNLGGISNISFNVKGKRIAYDIAPCNLPLNKWTKTYFDQSYDEEGQLAASGVIIPELLEKLEKLEYYSASPPKSLGVEWLDAHFYPILDTFGSHPKENILHTIVEHEVKQIQNTLGNYAIREVLITGGGALNTYFIQRLREMSQAEIIIPSQQLVEFKEALVFGLLGVLRIRNEVNTLCSVTGADHDSSGGEITFPVS